MSLKPNQIGSLEDEGILEEPESPQVKNKKQKKKLSFNQSAAKVSKSEKSLDSKLSSEDSVSNSSSKHSPLEPV